MSTRDHIHLPKNLGDKIADTTASGIGSWGFIITQAILMAIWFILNTAGWFIWKWDLYPFVFLNLAMSAEAAFSAPIIMMSQNRQSSKDRIRDDTEAVEVDDLHRMQADLYHLNQQQLSILNQQTEILQLLREQQQKPRKRQEATTKNGEKVI